MRAVPVAPPSSPACPLPTGIKAVQGAAPVTLHHRAKGTRGPSWMSPEHQCGYGEPMLRGHCAAAGHRVGLGGVTKPRGAVVSQRHGDNVRHGSVPVPTNPAAERGWEQIATPCPTALCCPLAAPQHPPAQGHTLPCAFGEGASRQRGSPGAPHYHHLPRPIPAKI